MWLFKNKHEKKVILLVRKGERVGGRLCGLFPSDLKIKSYITNGVKMKGSQGKGERKNSLNS